MGAGYGIQGFGAPLQRDIVELEQTASTEVAKLNSSLVVNTLDVPLTKLGGNIWRYEASGEKPVLPMFLSTHITRLNLSESQKPWQAQYEKMLEKLPTRLKLRLLMAMKKGGIKDPQMQNLAHVLQTFAKGLHKLNELKKLNIKAFDKDRKKNKTLTKAIGINWLAVIKRVLKKIDQISQNLKSNDPFVEELKVYKRKLEEFIQDFEKFLKIKKEGKEKIYASNKVIKQLNDLNKWSKKILSKRHLQVIGILFDSARQVIQSLLVSQGSHFWLSLAIAHTGIDIKKSPLGIFGPSISKGIHIFASGLPQIKTQSKYFIEKMIKTFYLFGIGLITCSSDIRKGSELITKEAKEIIGSYVFQLSATAFMHSTLIFHTTKMMTQYLEKQENIANLVAHTTSLLTDITVIKSAVKACDDEEVSFLLLQSTKPLLEKNLKAIKKALNDKVFTGVHYDIKHFLNQMLLAVEKKDITSFQAGLEKLFFLLGSQRKEGEKEIEKIINCFENLTQTIKEINEEIKNTTMAVQVPA